MKAPLVWLKAHPEYYGFMIGMACLALTAAAYRLTWEIPRSAMPNQQDLAMPSTSNTEPETEEQAALGARRQSVPLQRIDPPPQLQRTVPPPPPTQPAAPPKFMTLRRSAPQRGFAPNVPVDIRISIEKGEEEAVEMLVLEETLPPGWTFLRAESAAPLDAQPIPNAGDTLHFAWKEPSNFPLTLRYTLMPNPQHSEPQTLQSRLTYQAGGVTKTPPVASLVIQPAATP